MRVKDLFIFFAGAAWRGAGVFPTAEKWFSYVMDFAARVRFRKSVAAQ